MNDQQDDPLAGISDDDQAAAASAAWDPKLSEPVRKGGFPRWLWYGCGCGCFLMLVATVVIGVMTARLIGSINDPEKQWPKLGEVLAFDERPADLELQMGISFFGVVSEYRLVDEEDGYHVIVRRHAAPEQVSALMDPDTESPVGTVVGGERFEFELQGRTVSALRFEEVQSELPFMVEDVESQLDLGPGVRVRIPRDSGGVVVELRTPDGGDAITDEQIDDFFSHFDVWR